MAIVATSMSMSLDGFVTGPDDSRENPFGTGAEGLHDWIFGDKSTDEDAAIINEMIERAGPVVMGRRSFDKNEGDGGWGEGGPLGDTPVFVVTHNPPTKTYPSVYTFVTDVATAIEQAKKLAEDKVVGLHGATIPQQALALGLLDEINLQIVPVLLNGGTRMFEHLGGQYTLERTRCVATPAATHLRFRVVR